MSSTAVPKPNFKTAVIAVKSKPKPKVAAKKNVKPAKKTAKKPSTAASATKQLKEKQMKAKQRSRELKKQRLREKLKREKARAATLSKKDKRLLKQFPDPKAPKRPLTSYFRYAAHFQAQKKESLPIMSRATMATISAAISKGWKSAPPQQKEKYARDSTVQFKAYAIAKKAYDDGKGRDKWLLFLKQHYKSRPPSAGYNGFVKESFADYMKTNVGKKNAASVVIKVLCVWYVFC